MDGIRQLTVIFVPPIAGLVIAFFGEAVSAAGYDADGFALAFAIDAATSPFPSFTLMQVRVSREPAAPHDRQHAVGMIVECLRYCWADTNLRITFLYTAVAYIFVGGPVVVAIPILATQVGSNATALGYLTSAHGTGVFLGMAPQVATVALQEPGIHDPVGGHCNAAAHGHVEHTCLELRPARRDWNVRRLSVHHGYELAAALCSACHDRPGNERFHADHFWPPSGVFVGWLLKTITVNQLFAGTAALLLIIVTLARALSPMHHIGAKASII